MAELIDWPWRHWAQCRPDAVALTVDDSDWSWHALAGHCDRLAAHFAQQGVAPGAIVALRGKNSAEMLFSYLALLQCGARVLPLNPQLPASLITTLLASLNIDYLLNIASHNDLPANLLPLMLSYPEQDEIQRLAGDSTVLPWQVTQWATLTLTSGSSGLPKAVVHCFAAHLASARAVVQLMDFGPQAGWLLSLPLFHVSGQGIVWRWLSAGGQLLIRATASLAQALQGCSHASLVPTQLWRLLAQGDVPVSLKAVLLGGATIPLELTQQAEKQGIRCWCGYGLTELASTVCAKRADARPGVGLPLEAREIRLVNDEILLRGASLAAGYWRDGALIPLTDDDGWFHTRDRGAFQHGEWHILGRLDNQFFSGGEGIQPENIEALLLSHPDVRQACVVPIADPEFGHRPVAVIELAEGVSMLTIQDWLTPQLAGFQRPVAYFFLPPSLQGGGIKIARQQIKIWVQRHSRLDVN